VMWPSWVQWFIVAGSFGWFGLLFLVFVKVFPSVSMYECKEMVLHRRELANKEISPVMANNPGGGAPATGVSSKSPGVEGS